jgi:hypothetical protein
LSFPVWIFSGFLFGSRSSLSHIYWSGLEFLTSFCVVKKEVIFIFPLKTDIRFYENSGSFTIGAHAIIPYSLIYWGWIQNKFRFLISIIYEMWPITE